jgi:hypothetical protein
VLQRFPNGLRDFVQIGARTGVKPQRYALPV